MTHPRVYNFSVILIVSLALILNFRDTIFSSSYNTVRKIIILIFTYHTNQYKIEQIEQWHYTYHSVKSHRPPF